MIFDGRPINEIADAEISALVDQHAAERRHLEFKATVDHRNDLDRLETLRDVASLANGGGGYLFIGIRDDGRGCAQRFEAPGDAHRIATSIRDLALEYINPRIDGLEIRERTVNGHGLVIVRVPVSPATPHMVTYQRGTHFVARYEDGKREMTLAEIRGRFTEDLLNRRLATIEEGIGGLTRATAGAERRDELLTLVRADEPLARLGAVPGDDLSRVNAAAFRVRIGDRPAFYMSATPDVLERRIVDVDRPEIQTIFRQAPDSHPHGWIVTRRLADVERFGEGVRYRGHDLRTGQLELLTNGHLLYAALLGEIFYWQQGAQQIAEQPRIWPHAVIEYPLSLLKLFRGVVDLCGLRAPFHIRVQYSNIARHLLPAGAPTEFGFLWMHEAVPYANTNLDVYEATPLNFEPDNVARNLIRDVYAAFGYPADRIPFWNPARNRFEFPGR